MAVSSLKEEAPLKTKLAFLAFLLVAILPLVQPNYRRGLANQSKTCFAIAEAGPTIPATLKVSPANRSRSSNNGSSVGIPSDLVVGVMALARSVQMWMGL
jgi:hypothetical protein